MSGGTTDYITNFILNGRDNFSGTFDKLKGQLGDVQHGFGKLEALLTGGLVGGFTMLIKNAIDVGDHLWTMHERTGLSVATLGGLSIAADQSGTSLEMMARASRTLYEKMIESREPTSEAAKAFKSIGVSAFDSAGNMKPLDQMLATLAGRFNTYADGPEKSANANYYFGRSGAEMLPVLRLGEEELSKMSATHLQLGGHTDQSAAAADAFNDKMVLVKLASQGLWTQIATGLLPTLNQLAQMYINSAKESDKYNNSLSLTQVLVKGLSMVGIALVAVFQTAGDTIGAMLAYAWDKISNFGRGSTAILVDWGQQTMNRFDTMAGRIKTIWDGPAAEVAAKSESTAAQLVMPLAKAKVKAEALKDEFGPIIQKFETMYTQALAEVENGYDKTTKAEQAWLALQQSPVWDKLTADQKIQAALVMERAHNQQELNEKMKDFAKVAQEAQKYADEYAKGIEEWKRSINDNASAFVDLMNKMEEEIELSKLSGVAHDAAAAKLRLEADYRAGLIPTYDEYIDRLGQLSAAYSKVASTNDAREQMGRNAELWSSIANAGESAFQKLFEKGGNVFRDLADIAKKTLLDILYQLTAKQWLVSLGVSSGMLSGEAGATIMGQGTGSGITGLLSNAVSASNLYQGALASMTMSGGYAAGASIGAGATGYLGFAGSEAGMALGLSAATTTAEGVGITALTSVGSAIPVIGWIIAAAALLYAIFAKPGGGPKSGGFAASGSDSALWDRFFTPSDQDAELRKTTQAWQKDYRNLVTGLGGKVREDMTFALGFDSDVQGDAGNRISAGISAGGQALWAIRDKGVGNDVEGLQRELGITYSTALAQAIKASDLPGIVGKVWAEVGTVTQEQLNRMIRFSEALIVIQNAVDADILEDVAKVESMAKMTAIDNYKASAAALQEMSRQYDGSEQATYDLAAATNQFRVMALQLVIAIDNVIESFSKTIEASKRTVQMTGLTGEPLRDFLQAEIDRLYTQMGTETDPAKIKTIAEQINANILQMFGTFSGEDQLAQKSHYLEWLDAIEAQVTARLEELKSTITGNGESSYATVMATVGTQLAAAGDRITQAAADMQTAADTMNAAAASFKAGTNVTITVNTTTGEVGVSGQ